MKQNVGLWDRENEHRLHYEVSALLFRYARGVDRKDWDALASVFFDDAHDDHGFQRGTAAEFIQSMKNSTAFVPQMMHLTSNVSLLEVDRDARAALVESYCLGTQRLDPSSPVIPQLYGTENHENGLVLTVANRYVDRFEERDGVLRIASRTVIYEWHTVVPSGEHQIFNSVTVGLRSKDDASYRRLLDCDDA